MSAIDMDWVHDLIGRYSDHIEGNTCTFHNGAYARMAEEIAAMVGNRIDLSKRLRGVHGLHAFAELFGFSWTDGSDWDWHDVACAMADAIDATVGGYAITFAESFDRPPETMVGETVYDSEGNAIGWITDATAGVGTCQIETTESWLPAERYHRCKHCGAFFAVLNASHDIPPRVCPNCGKRIKVVSA